MNRTFVQRCLVAFMLCTAALSARAETLQCGLYESTGETNAWLRVIDGEVLEKGYGELSGNRHWYGVAGRQIQLVGDEFGMEQRMVREDGPRGALRPTGDSADSDASFRLTRPAPCAQIPRPPAGACRRDLQGCAAKVAQQPSADTLRSMCEEGLLFGCKQWLEALRDAAKPAPEVPPELARVCDEKSKSFNTAACEQAVNSFIGQAFADALSQSFAAKTSLPDDVLTTLSTRCAQSGSVGICELTANELLQGNRVSAWHDARLQSCRLSPSLAYCAGLPRVGRALTGTAVLGAARTLPCGTWQALDTTTLYETLTFGDRGRVEIVGGTLRGRIEDGAIRIRHDKGGDFVLRPLGNDLMVGLDHWTLGNVYAHTSPAGTCAAPVVYRERPLPNDCPNALKPGEPGRCCAANRLQGCNVRGNQHALANRWSEAAADYARVCEAGIRVGCENLASASMRVSSDNPEKTMATICAKQPGHVACDVLETTNWAAGALVQALESLSKEMEAELDEDSSGDSEENEDARAADGKSAKQPAAPNAKDEE